ncbi:uncharacterized protein LOC110817019 [Carica papaya]|uniref:uncharacterized protein LOC110817019 n=1 Tax=Carica papaya TaxID=3649 RepID=UPI000B8C6E4A|nr:uncharacterized protein LOC110817019 [Carica papaya]
MGGGGCYSKGGSNVINYRGGGGGRRWWCSWWLILMLAFVAALAGVMAVHRLRERRIFNLLLQQKNTHLLSLQLLLQKEREYSTEMKGRAEELKAKIYAVNAQKMELDRRLLEMQSTIDSLRDEQKVISHAMKEKQKEIELLRDKDSWKHNPQLMTLTEIIKQKESEIQELKHQIEYPVRIFPGNLTTNESIAEAVKAEDDWKNEDQKAGNVRNLTTAEEGNENRTGIHANRVSPANAAKNATEVIVETNNNVMKARDEGNEVKPMNGHQVQKITRDKRLGSLADSQQDQGTSMDVNSRVPTGFSLSRQNLSKAKGRRWRMLAKSGLMWKDDETSMKYGAKSVGSTIPEDPVNGISEAYRYHSKDKGNELQKNTSVEVGIGNFTNEIGRRNMSNRDMKRQESKDEDVKGVERREMFVAETEDEGEAGQANLLKESIPELEEDKEDTEEDEF